MDELSKCPNCAETDKVTIAGKVFCVKCGTADTTTPDAATQVATPNPPVSPPVQDQSGALASVQKFQTIPPAQQNNPVGAFPASSDVPQPQPVVDQQTTSTQPPVVSQVPQPVTEPVAPLSPQNLQKDGLDPAIVVPPSSNPPITSPPASPLVSQLSQTTPAPNVISPAVVAPPQVVTTEEAATTSETINSPQPAQSPLDTSLPVAPLLQTTARSDQTTVSSVASNSTVSQIPTSSSTQTQNGDQFVSANSVSDITKPASRVPEHVGSELMSLDKKDNTVFSDEQLHELAQITTESQPTQTPQVQARSNIAPSQPEAQTTTARPHTMQVDQMNLRTSNPVSTADIKPVSKPNTVSQPVPTPVSAKPEPSLEHIVENSKPSKTDKEPHRKSKKGVKPASIALAIAALFLVGAYIWQVNYPNLAFKIASAKAGINASLPGYMPNGWKMAGEIQTNPGTVSYNLSNKDDSKKAIITQTKTDWDSQALAENYVSPKAENYLALQAQGLTIYVYGSGQAAWVNKGNWYRIESGDQSLTQDQIIKIATSL